MGSKGKVRRVIIAGGGPSKPKSFLLLKAGTLRRDTGEFPVVEIFV